MFASTDGSDHVVRLAWFLAICAGTCGRCLAADNPAVPAVVAFASPQAVFEVYRTAHDRKDWRTVFNCCTKDLQNKLVVEGLFSCWMQPRKPKVKKLLEQYRVQEDAITEEYYKRYKKKHGIDLEAELQRDPKETPQEPRPLDDDLMNEIIADAIRDKSGFFVAYSTALQNNEWQPRFDKLQNVSIQADVATGSANCHTFSVTNLGAGEIERVPEVSEMEFSFRKVGTSWYMEFAL